MHTWGLPLGARISPMASIQNRTALDLIGWTLGFFIQLIYTIQTLLYTAGIYTNAARLPRKTLNGSAQRITLDRYLCEAVHVSRGTTNGDGL